MLRNRIELLFSVLLVMLLGWMIWETRAWPIHSRIFPLSIGVAVLLLALAQVAASMRRVVRSGSPDDFDATMPPDSEQREPQGTLGARTERGSLARRRVAVICSWILVFFLGIWSLGFRVGSFVLTVAFLRLAASENWRVSLAAGAISYLFFLLVFHWVLQVPLPAGLLAESLGMDSLDDYAVRSLRDLVQ